MLAVISIPSGTIKSGGEGENNIKSIISIPSGTIKSGLIYTDWKIGELFQFLLVRLKVFGL